MDARTVLTDLARRPVDALAYATLAPRSSTPIPAGAPTPPVWLLWHAGREIDVQVSALSGQPQVWTADGWAARFSSHVPDDDMGYGDTAEQAREIDRSWTPPVTRAARLVSVSEDALQHIGQVAYVMGMPHA